MPNLIRREAIPSQHTGITNMQHTGNLGNSGYYYNSTGQLYLDPQGTHNNPGVPEIYPTQAYSSMQEQPTHRRMQLNPPVMPHVQGNCHWCGKTSDEVALDALAAYTIATEYPVETVRDRNIRSPAYLDGFEAALICFKKAGQSQPRACAGSGVQRSRQMFQTVYCPPLKNLSTRKTHVMLIYLRCFNTSCVKFYLLLMICKYPYYC